MKLVDANLLLYAVNVEAARHEAARTWLEETLSDEEPVGLAWVVVLAFLRVSTHSRVFPNPLDPAEALGVVDGWLARRTVRMIRPGEEHWRIMRDLLEDVGTAGNLTTDAHLAALAIEHGAELVSTDTDFQRFPRLRWADPIPS